MKKLAILFLLLCTVAIFAADQATPYVLTEFPLAILPADSAIWIKWSGLSENGSDTVDAGAEIRFSREPGGNDIADYSLRLNSMNEAIEYDVVFSDKDVKERGIKFRPGDIADLETGIYYLRVFYEGTLQTFYSNEIKFIVRSGTTAELLSPKGTGVSDVTPTFSWKKVPYVPYYHIIVTDEAVTIGDDNSLDGLSIIWQAITDGTQIVYGAPDPSGTISASPPPLSPGVTYSWFALNNYGNNPAMTAVDVVLPNQFSLVGDTMETPIPLSPDSGDTLFSTDYESAPFTLTWTNLDSNANTFKAYLYSASQDTALPAQIAMWDGEVTAGSFEGRDTGSIEIDAKNILTTNLYSWKVIAVDNQGYGQSSRFGEFYYQSVSGGALVRTKETIKTSSGSVEQDVGLCEIKVEVLDGSMEPPLLFYTDQNGYLYRDRPIGTYRFTAVKDGYSSATKTVTITKDDTSFVTIYLERPDASVNGKVVDNEGNGLITTKITAISTLGDTVTTETDPDGNFVVNCGKGDWDIYATKKNYTTPLPVRVTVDFGDSKSLDNSIVLVKNSFSVSGVVTNENGENLVAAKVELKNSTGVVVASVPSTPSSGEFAFTVNSGTYTLAVSKTGFTAFSQSITITSSVNKTVVLKAGASQITGSIFGKSWGFDGNQTVAAIRNMEIVALDADENEVASSVTDSWGAFTLSVPGGFVKYKLVYSATGYEEGSIYTDNVTAGVTYKISDTLTGYANIQGRVTKSGSDTAVGDIQISLVDKATNDVYKTAKSDFSGSFEMYSIPDGEYRIVAAGTGLFADSIRVGLFDNSEIDTSGITVNEGRSFVGEVPIKSIQVTVEEGTGSIYWSTTSSGTGLNNIKVISPLSVKLDSEDTLENVGLGDYTIEVDAVADSVLDCSKHITSVVDNGVLLVDSVVLPFTHVVEDTAKQTGSVVYLDIKYATSLISVDSISSAKIYYKDYEAETFQTDTVSSITNGVVSFVVTPPKTGTYMEYYFNIVLANGDVFGYKKEVLRSYVEPDPTVITRLEMVPATDTNGYVMSRNGKLRFELKGYYGDNYRPLDAFSSSLVTWSTTGPISVDKQYDSAAVDVMPSGAGTATIKAVFNGGTTYTLGDGVESEITAKITVTDADVASLTVTHEKVPYISSRSSTQFVVNAKDSNGKAISVSPTWYLFPKNAGVITHDGVFTPDSQFAGRVKVIASVNEILGEYYASRISEGASEDLIGLMVGYGVKNSGVTIFDGLGLQVTFPDSAIDTTQTQIVVGVEHPDPANRVNKTVPLEGVSLISNLYEIEKISDSKFRSDSIDVEGNVVSRLDEIVARVKVPAEYNEFLDGSGSKFSLGIWSPDSLTWSHKWNPENETVSRADDSTLIPRVMETIQYNSSDSTFSIEVGELMNSTGEVRLAVLFNESEDVQGAVTVSPNPFSPYVAPRNDYISLPGMSDEYKGTCIKITPMSSTTGKNPSASVRIYTANRTLVWETLLPTVIPGKDYYLFWDGKTRRGRGELGDLFTIEDNKPIRPVGTAMCRNGRYFAVITIDDGEVQKRFTKEIILFK